MVYLRKNNEFFFLKGHNAARIRIRSKAGRSEQELKAVAPVTWKKIVNIVNFWSWSKYQMESTKFLLIFASMSLSLCFLLCLSFSSYSSSSLLLLCVPNDIFFFLSSFSSLSWKKDQMSRYSLISSWLVWCFSKYWRLMPSFHRHYEKD